MHPVFVGQNTHSERQKMIFCQRRSCVANCEDIAYAKPCGKLCDGLPAKYVNSLKCKGIIYLK